MLLVMFDSKLSCYSTYPACTAPCRVTSASQLFLLSQLVLPLHRYTFMDQKKSSERLSSVWKASAVVRRSSLAAVSGGKVCVPLQVLLLSK